MQNVQNGLVFPWISTGAETSSHADNQPAEAELRSSDESEFLRHLVQLETVPALPPVLRQSAEPTDEDHADLEKEDASETDVRPSDGGTTPKSVGLTSALPVIREQTDHALQTESAVKSSIPGGFYFLSELDLTTVTGAAFEPRVQSAPFADPAVMTSSQPTSGARTATDAAMEARPPLKPAYTGGFAGLPLVARLSDLYVPTSDVPDRGSVAKVPVLPTAAVPVSPAPQIAASPDPQAATEHKRVAVVPASARSDFSQTAVVPGKNYPDYSPSGKEWPAPIRGALFPMSGVDGAPRPDMPIMREHAFTASAPPTSVSSADRLSVMQPEKLFAAAGNARSDSPDIAVGPQLPPPLQPEILAREIVKPGELYPALPLPEPPGSRMPESDVPLAGKPGVENHSARVFVSGMLPLPESATAASSPGQEMSLPSGGEITKYSYPLGDVALKQPEKQVPSSNVIVEAPRNTVRPGAAYVAEPALTLSDQALPPGDVRKEVPSERDRPTVANPENATPSKTIGTVADQAVDALKTIMIPDVSGSSVKKKGDTLKSGLITLQAGFVGPQSSASPEEPAGSRVGTSPFLPLIPKQAAAVKAPELVRAAESTTVAPASPPGFRAEQVPAASLSGPILAVPVPAVTGALPVAVALVPVGSEPDGTNVDLDASDPPLKGVTGQVLAQPRPDYVSAPTEAAGNFSQSLVDSGSSGGAGPVHPPAGREVPQHHSIFPARAELPSQLPAQLTQAVVTASGPVTELRLAPEELGSVRIEVQTDRDKASITLLAERPETLDLLRRHSDRLVAEFRAAGFTEMTLGFGSLGTGEQGRPQTGADNISSEGGETADSADTQAASEPSAPRETSRISLYRRL